MALTNSNSRYSMLGFGGQNDLLPIPDGTVEARDRLLFISLYGGLQPVSASDSTSTTTPTPPEVEDIVTQALRLAGRVNPTATQIVNATTHQLAEVKTDIMRVAETHPLLQTTSVEASTRGYYGYNYPDDFNVPIAVILFDGPDTWRGTAQTGGSTSITLAADLDVTDDQVAGKYIVITAGTGVDQFNTIRSWNNSTKVATVRNTWTTTPSSDSTYLIVDYQKELEEVTLLATQDPDTRVRDLGTPRTVSHYANSYNVSPVPDKSTYALMLRYYADITQLSESGTVFLRLLRKWRSVWIQGLMVKLMQLPDDEQFAKKFNFSQVRYQYEVARYESMLNLLAEEACLVRRGNFTDI